MTIFNTKGSGLTRMNFRNLLQRQSFTEKKNFTVCILESPQYKSFWVLVFSFLLNFPPILVCVIFFIKLPHVFSHHQRYRNRYTNEIKNQYGFQRNRSTTSQILTIRRILEGVRAKNLQATILFVDFTKAFDSIHRGKTEQILLAYGLPKETVAAITILYRNTKVKVRSLDGDTEYFDIVAGVLQGDTLAPYRFINCLDYVLRTSIDKINENGFELTKKRSRRYPAKIITDADYADDIPILPNTPNQAETLLHSLELQALAPMSMYTKRNTCALIKQTTFPL